MKKCSQCPAPAEAGRSRCRRCLDAVAALMRAKTAGGRCRCGEPATPGKKSCEACRATGAAVRKAKYYARKDAGACVVSGCDRQPKPGHVYCRTHLRELTLATTESRRKKNGRK